MTGRFLPALLLGLALLALAYVLFLVAGFALFGLAMVRADAFALGSALYWCGGLALAAAGAWVWARAGAGR